MRLSAVAVIAVALGAGSLGAAAQTMGMDHRGPAAAPSTQLTIQGPDGKSITLTPADLAAMPHKTVAVFNAHDHRARAANHEPKAEG